MRLINVDTLELQSFTDDYEAPPFVILSHCWGEEEVTLQDAQSLPYGELSLKAGWRKISNFCLLIEKYRELTDHLGERCSWAWVDTCCIDKTSSAELSEAINSMFRWYRKATCCFVWLPDVEGQSKGDELVASPDFEESRWFTRGWTLQELLAPHSVYFFDKLWGLLGDKKHLAERIAKITAIDMEALESGNWDHCNIAQRMSWAANRQTTRREDLAYCLMGLFEVNMPLLYGEGDRAFIRLQEAIMKESDDQSILAWDASIRHPGHIGFDSSTGFLSIGALATHPSQFENGALIETLPSQGGCATLTARGIQIDAPIVNQQLAARGTAQPEEIKVALLSCRFFDDINSRVGICVSPDEHERTIRSGARFVRARKPRAIIRVPWRGPPFLNTPTIYIAKSGKKMDHQSNALWRCVLEYGGIGKNFKIIHAEPEQLWFQSSTPSCTMVLPRYEGKATNAVVVFEWSSYPGKVFNVLMSLAPYNQNKSSIGLRWVDESAARIFDAHDIANSILGEMNELGGGLNASNWLELPGPEDGSEMIQAKLDIRSDFVFEISLSKVRRPRQIAAGP